MTAAARAKAERCFALARSTTFDGERRNAVDRGVRIAEAAGLDLDSFDIPGRAKTKATPPPRSRFRDDMFERERSPFFTGDWTREDIADVWERFTRHMRESAADAAKAERDYRQARREGDPNRSGEAMNRLRADLAVAWHWQLDPPIRVYQGSDEDGERRWIIPEDGDLEYSDEGLIEVAQRRGWDGRDVREDREEAIRAAMRRHGGNVYPFGPMTASDAKIIGEASAFLRRAGIKCDPIADSDYWHVDGEVMQSRTMILAARLRGFE